MAPVTGQPSGKRRRERRAYHSVFRSPIAYREFYYQHVSCILTRCRSGSVAVINVAVAVAP